MRRVREERGVSDDDGEKEVVLLLLLLSAVPYAAFVQTANMASKASLGGLPLSVQRAVTISPSRTVSTRSVDGLPAEEANKRQAGRGPRAGQLP